VLAVAGSNSHFGDYALWAYATRISEWGAAIMRSSQTIAFD